MARKNRDGHVVIRSERAFDPIFKHHTPSGDGICVNKADAKEWATRTNAEQGRHIVVDPDGGVPGGSEADRRYMEQERREYNERGNRAINDRREEFARRLADRRR